AAPARSSSPAPGTRNRDGAQDVARRAPAGRGRCLLPGTGASGLVAASAAEVAAATARAATLLVLGLVHLEGAAAEVAAVEGADRVRRGVLVRHLDEGEAARAAGLAVHDDAHGLDRPVAPEGALQVLLGAGVRKVAHVDLLAH